MSSLLSRLLPVVLLGLLLAFPALSVAGAQSGLLLWFNVVLPTLSPFIICTQMVIALDAVELLIRPFYPAIRALFGLSPKGSYVLLCGLLCGYPLGARLCSQYLEGGSITKAEADYLLAICNHPSPMFLLGYVCSQIPFVVSPLLLMTCLYLPVLPSPLQPGGYTEFPAPRPRLPPRPQTPREQPSRPRLMIPSPASPWKTSSTTPAKPWFSSAATSCCSPS